jgi:hypothetical protein
MTDSLPQPVTVPASLAPPIRRYTHNAKATKTRKAYRIDWDNFLGWCVLRHRAAMPAAPEPAAEYLVHLAEGGAIVAVPYGRVVRSSGRTRATRGEGQHGRG